MKRFIAVALAMIMVCSLTACGKSKRSKKDNDKDPDKAETFTAQDCLSAVIHADCAEDLDDLTTNNYDGYFEKLQTIFPKEKYIATAEKVTDYKEYEVYECEIKEASNPDSKFHCFEVFKKGGKGYLIETDQAVIDEIVEKYRCSTCQGSGKLAAQGNACAICSGTGVQYYPNAYYDAALQMWMGETRACSGCAGPGTVGGMTETCHRCQGHGVVFS